MKRFVFLVAMCSLLIISANSQAKIDFYKDLAISATIIDNDNVVHKFHNLTYTIELNGNYYMALDFLTGYYGGSKVQVPIERISNMKLDKAPNEVYPNSDRVDLIAFISIMSGETRRIMIASNVSILKHIKFYFAGKTSFGEEVINLWNIKELIVEGVAGPATPVESNNKGSNNSNDPPNSSVNPGNIAKDAANALLNPDNRKGKAGIEGLKEKVLEMSEGNKKLKKN